MIMRIEVVQPQYEKGKSYTIELSKLQPDPDQPRKYFDEEAAQVLKDSVQRLGVLEPVWFRQDPVGRLVIVAGERRCRAAIEAGLSTITAHFTDGDPLEISLNENFMRENLNAVEEAEALQRMMEIRGYRQEDLGKVVGKAQSTLSEILSINRLPQEIRDECRQNPKCPRRVLVEIARKETPEEMMAFYKILKKRGLTTDQIREPKKRGRTDQAKAAQEMADAAVAIIVRLKKVLDEIDFGSLTEKSRGRLQDELEGLKIKIAEKA